MFKKTCLFIIVISVLSADNIITIKEKQHLLSRTKIELQKEPKVNFSKNSLTKTSYDKILSQYIKEYPEYEIKNHRFQNAIDMSKKYCEMGLPEACGNLGLIYMIPNVGVKRNPTKASLLLQHAMNNSIYPIFKEFFSYQYTISYTLSKYSDSQVIEYINKLTRKKSDDCKENTGDSESCFQTLILLSTMPNDLFGINQELVENLFKIIVDTDMRRKGAEKSKAYQYIYLLGKLTNKI